MRTALITGAASGIGRAACAALARDGFRVVGLDLKGADLCADVSDPVAVGAALAGIERIDALVNAAGILIEGRLGEIAMADLDRLLAVNVKGPFVVTQAALSRMPEGSAIVNVASELAYLGRARASAYAATKGAILSATRSWARELAPGIRVNAVAPGPVDTPLLGFAGMTAAERSLETANPMGRIGQPEEIAAVIAFLCGPGAGFVTGQCFSADGGAAMH